jgi:hypothetical protein
MIEHMFEKVFLMSEENLVPKSGKTRALILLLITPIFAFNGSLIKASRSF